MYVGPDHSVRATADLSEWRPGLWALNRIVVGDVGSRGLGHGEALLRRVLADADADGVTLVLDVLPEDFGGGEPEARRLRAWYGRHGFVVDENHDRLMTRAPANTV